MMKKSNITTIDLTQTIARSPFYVERPRKLGAWSTFWISTSFWLILVVALCGFTWGIIRWGSVVTQQLIESHQHISNLEELKKIELAEREQKIERLESYRQTTSGEMIAMAKLMQEIYETASNRSQSRFLDEALPEALKLQVIEGIPASAAIAMAIYESQYGQSKLARDYHNYFGMKAFDNWKGRRAEDMNTRDSGVATVADFRAYDDISAGFKGYADFLKSSDRYDRAFKARNGVEFVSALLKGGYCPDATYLDSIRTIMTRHKLDKLDNFKAEQMATSPKETPPLDGAS